MNNTYSACFDAEGINDLYRAINEMGAGDILNLKNRVPGDVLIVTFASSLLTGGFTGKFLVSCRESGDEVYGLTVGRTAT